MKQNYLIVKVNYSDENENEDLLKKYPEVPAYPHFFVLDSNGDLLHSQGTGELEKGDSYDEDVFLAFLNEWTPESRDPSN